MKNEVHCKQFKMSVYESVGNKKTAQFRIGVAITRADCGKNVRNCIENVAFNFAKCKA